jgi:hypothetical protein
MSGGEVVRPLDGERLEVGLETTCLALVESELSLELGYIGISEMYDA